MARDYKNRTSKNRARKQAQKVAWWKWLLIVFLIALFVMFLVFLRNSAPEPQKTQVQVIKKIKKIVKQKANEPRFDFYTILPETEIVVPDYEISTRNREEKFGKAKATKYLIQAGSFRDFSEADKLRARLALMGIESRVEKANVGNVVWNRVKIGPYSRSSSVSAIKKRLRDNHIDVIVTEIKS
ncbi:MAG: SPOR domain-containing protein [Methylococcales bacterium]|nr:SPOR domain-containing protein [Methylococcales bacterium]